MTFFRTSLVWLAALVSPLFLSAQACDDVTLLLDANIGAGGPSMITASVSGGDGAMYTESFNLGESSAAWDICLPAGCLTLEITAACCLGPDLLDIEIETLEGPMFPDNLFWDPSGTAVTLEFSLDGSCTASECPEGFFLDSGEECGSMVAEIGSFVEGESVVWNYGDGTVETGGHFTTHTYAENGTYEVVGVYTSPACLGQTYTGTLTIDCYNGEDCAPEMQVNTGVVCNAYIFALTATLEEGVNWYVNDELVEDNYASELAWSFTSGVFNVCATYTTEACPEGVEVCQTIEVDCGGDCPEEIAWEPSGDCGNTAFSIPGIDGETIGIQWTFGDAGEYPSSTAATEFQFEENGVYEVCATLETPSCPFGITLCTEVEIDCFSSCPDSFWSGAGEGCGAFSFEIGSFQEGESVEWSFGDETSETGGHFITHTYTENGVYEVCGTFTSNDCPEGVTLCGTVEVDCIADACTPDVTVQEEACNSWNFTLGTDPDVWYGWLLNGELQEDNVLEWGYTAEEAGVYTICLQYETDDCGLASWCETFEVSEDCLFDPCEINANIESDPECGAYVFWAESADPEIPVLWQVNDLTFTGEVFEFLPEEAGEYVICVTNQSDLCPEAAEVCFEIEVPTSCFEDCPDEIVVTDTDNCGDYVFEVAGLEPGTTVEWTVGGNLETGGPATDWLFSENGVYEICAFVETPECPSGVEICTEVEVDCFGIACTEVFFGFDLAEGTSSDQAIGWSFYDDNAELVAEGWCTYATSPWCDTEVCIGEGCHTLYLNFELPIESLSEIQLFANDNMGGLVLNNTYFAENGLEATFQFSTDESCGEVMPDCPDSMYAGAMDDCGWWEFEIGSFVEGELVEWTFGDGTTVTGGHYIQHEFTEPGMYEACGFYTSPECPDGVELCATFEVEDCGCTPVELYFDTNLELGGPEAITGVVTDEFLNAAALIECTYSETEQYCDVSLCLADGCYNVALDLGAGTSLDGLEYGVVVNGEEVSPNLLFANETLGVLSYEFGVNSACGDGVDEEEDHTFTAYPNPANGAVTLQWNAPVTGQLWVFDGSGRQISQHKLRSTSTEQLTDLATGVYLVRFVPETGAAQHLKVVVR